MLLNIPAKEKKKLVVRPVYTEGGLENEEKINTPVRKRKLKLIKKDKQTKMTTPYLLNL